MKFMVFSDDPTLHRAAILVEKYYNDPEFLNILSKVPKFNNTNNNGQKVAFDIEDSHVVMKVKLYKTKFPWSKTIGYAEGDTIWVNSRKLDLSLADRTENFMHEPLHLLGYGHVGNYNNAFNRETVPYKVAAIFRQYLIDKGIV